MAPLVAVLVCWACAALLPGCDGKSLQDLLGSYKAKLQTDSGVASGAQRAFEVEVADASERVVEKPKAARSSSSKGKSSSSSKGKSDKHSITYMLSDVTRIVTGKGRDHKGRDRIDVKVPECPPHPMESLSEQERRDTPLKSWIASGIKVYEALDELWIPSEFMYKDKRTGHSKLASHKNADQRWKTTLDDYLRIKDDKGTSKYKEFKQSRELWKSVQQAMYSPEVEEALWEKLKMPRTGWKFRDFRVQTDAHGFAIGAHPDISKKILTMMIYLPSGSAKQQKAQEASYGTCLHTSAQYAKRSKSNGAAQCAVKFPFKPNVGYSFTVNRHSFHSASAGELGERRTIMLNWYKANPHNSHHG